MKLFFLIFLVATASGKILIDKIDIQVSPDIAKVTQEIKDGGVKVSIDIQCFAEGDDVVLEAAAYSKVDNVYNPFVRPDPIHICKIHEHEEPLIQFLHDEILKFGNITKACPLTKGYYYLHDFQVDITKFPMPLPEGSFRIDLNSSISTGGKLNHVASTEVYFRSVKE